MKRTVSQIAAREPGETVMLAWKSQGRAALVIGGGEVAAMRVRALLDGGAVVTVVSPRCNPELRLRARRGEITHHRRRFAAADLVGCAIVAVAVDDAALGRAVAALCRQRRLPVNVADRPALCDFFFPASHRQGPVQVAVATDGRAPGLAARLRNELAGGLPAELTEAVYAFGRLREHARARFPAAKDRMARLRRVVAGLSWRQLSRLRDDDMDELLVESASAVHARRGRRPGGRVLLVGAGPGDPGSMTVAARAALLRADLVLADRLVPAAIRDLATGEIRIADKRPGRADAAQAELQAWMIDGARRGLEVVRLKIGDPALFGRLGEELAALAAAGIEVEVLAGISSVSAAAAALGMPLTQRAVADRLVICTGVGQGGSRPQLPRFTPNTTYVFLMAMGCLEDLGHQLQAAGFPPELPGLCATSLGQAEQRVVRAPLAELPRAAATAALRAPGVILLGEVTLPGAVGAGARDAPGLRRLG